MDEDRRLYGDSWLAFLSDCRATLGTEAGASVFDVEDVVRLEYERQEADVRKIDFRQLKPRELFERYYRDRHAAEADTELLDLFDRVLDEVTTS